MPILETVLVAHDFVVLRAIAAQAGLTLNAPNPRAATEELAHGLLTKPEALELLLDRVLNANTRPALAQLLNNHGQQPVASFVRRFGDVRPLGPAALIREQPWDRPATASEALYFNGLMGRGFKESETGPQEFFYVASDLLPLLPTIDDTPLPASPALAVTPVDADDSQTQLATPILVDDLVTTLTGQQLHAGKILKTADLGTHLQLPVLDLLLTLANELGLITSDHRLDPDKVIPFLNATRAEQLKNLADTWRDSKVWNDLLRLPSLHAEPGTWHNDPIQARAFVLKLCADLPIGEWRSLESFVAYVRTHHPDFQRPAGDYDSWYIREASTSSYVRGFENWDKVDGELIRYLMTGPLHWLGLVDTRTEPDAFRLTPLFSAFIKNEAFPIEETPQKMIIKSGGFLRVTPEVNRFDRFQAARIGEWRPRTDSATDVGYDYQITGNSLQQAAAQGVTSRHIVAFLRRASEFVPEPLINLIERWGQHGIEARALNTTILKLASPEVLETLMRSPRTRRWLGEALGERAVEVKDWEKLREAMVELGLTAEVVERKK
jgi:Helicase conserved C-terminal domain